MRLIRYHTADIRQRCVHCMPSMARQPSSLRSAAFHPREAMRTFKPYPYHFPSKIGSSPHSGMRVGRMVLNLTWKKAVHLSARTGRVTFGWSCLTEEDLCIECAVACHSACNSAGMSTSQSVLDLVMTNVPFRRVLASLLGVDERVDWRSCLQSEEDDQADVQAFKTAFAPFDPSC